MAARKPSGASAKRPIPAAVLLTPGAGSSADHSCLVAIERAVAPIPVSRMDFPYRRAGRRAPDRAPVLVAAIIEGAGELGMRAGVEPSKIVLGGRSMGGRMCSMAVAGDDGTGPATIEPLPAAGLVLISYPLHPPGKPSQLRTAHLPSITVPCLFVHGTRDPFATPDELTEAAATINGPVTHVWIDGGRHDLRGADAPVAQAVVTWLASLKAEVGLRD